MKRLTELNGNSIVKRWGILAAGAFAILGSYVTLRCAISYGREDFRNVKNWVKGIEEVNEQVIIKKRKYDVQIIKEATEYYEKKQKEGIDIDFRTLLDHFQDQIDKPKQND